MRVLATCSQTNPRLRDIEKWVLAMIIQSNPTNGILKKGRCLLSAN